MEADMNPFIQMASVLSAAHLPAWTIDEPIPEGLNRTERIRRLLKASSRPVTANEIAWDMADHFPNFGSHLVWLLLKYEMEKGRVIFDKARSTYSWNQEYETAEAAAIRDALKLLKKHGYKVAL
jgi:hypothetical protein